MDDPSDVTAADARLIRALLDDGWTGEDGLRRALVKFANAVRADQKEIDALLAQTVDDRAACLIRQTRTR